MGFALLKQMREKDMVNIMCIPTRSCSPDFTQIQDRRFTHINDLC